MSGHPSNARHLAAAPSKFDVICRMTPAGQRGSWRKGGVKRVDKHENAAIQVTLRMDGNVRAGGAAGAVEGVVDAMPHELKPGWPGTGRHVAPSLATKQLISVIVASLTTLNVMQKMPQQMPQRVTAPTNDHSSLVMPRKAMATGRGAGGVADAEADVGVAARGSGSQVSGRLPKSLSRNIASRSLRTNPWRPATELRRDRQRPAALSQDTPNQNTQRRVLKVSGVAGVDDEEAMTHDLPPHGGIPNGSRGDAVLMIRHVPVIDRIEGDDVMTSPRLPDVSTKTTRGWNSSVSRRLAAHRKAVTDAPLPKTSQLQKAASIPFAKFPVGSRRLAL